jgi:hypothetical protein
VADPAELLKHPAVSLAAGAAAVATSGAVSAYRVCERLPVLGPQLQRGRTELTHFGEQVVARGVDPVKKLVTVVAVALVERVLDELDLTDLVRQRVDLTALANEVIDGVDLPAIIRESTGTVTAEVMTDVRTQGERADDAVSGFVDRLLGRDRELR